MAVDLVAEALSTSREEASRLLSRGHVRAMRFRGLSYYVLRRDFGVFEEGTSIIASRDGPVVVRGFPSIRRVLVLSLAVPRHFPGMVYVEEKMNGYNVRAVLVDGELYALTRGGYICPYTTARMRRLYGEPLSSLLESLGGYMVNGEVVGEENPYMRHRYPEAPLFGFFIFDIRSLSGNEPLPLEDRYRLVDEYGLQGVPLLGVAERGNVEAIRGMVARLDKEGREGVVMKDPENRVAPLKYTTSSANLGDIEAGMRFFFDEGRSYLYSRILREAFRVYESGGAEEAAERLGRAILEPLLASIEQVEEGGQLVEEFTLRFGGLEEAREFLAFYEAVGAPLLYYRVVSSAGEVVLRVAKAKETEDEFARILETGLSPLD